MRRSIKKKLKTKYRNVRGLPKWCGRIIRRCLLGTAKGRFSSVDELQSCLGKYLRIKDIEEQKKYISAYFRGLQNTDNDITNAMRADSQIGEDIFENRTVPGKKNETQEKSFRKKAAKNKKLSGNFKAALTGGFDIDPAVLNAPGRGIERIYTCLKLTAVCAGLLCVYLLRTTQFECPPHYALSTLIGIKPMGSAVQYTLIFNPDDLKFGGGKPKVSSGAFDFSFYRFERDFLTGDYFKSLDENERSKFYLPKAIENFEKKGYRKLSGNPLGLFSRILYNAEMFLSEQFKFIKKIPGYRLQKKGEFSIQRTVIIKPGAALFSFGYPQSRKIFLKEFEKHSIWNPEKMTVYMSKRIFSKEWADFRYPDLKNNTAVNVSCRTPAANSKAETMDNFIPGLKKGKNLKAINEKYYLINFEPHSGYYPFRCVPFPGSFFSKPSLTIVKFTGK